MPQIIATNIRAIGPIYAAAMLEDLQLFNVMDRLVSLFQSGLLPVGNKGSGEKLYQYWKQQGQRLSPSERTNLYYQVLGVGNGNAESTPNREFQDLWLRFIASVASVADQQAVRTAGSDLAANLSLHGGGFTYFAARDLQSQVKTIIGLLSAPDVRSAYAARSMWELIDKVASLDLGGARNSLRYRTMAESGSTIISWLASKARDLAGESTRPILGTQGNDRRLITACEQWITVQGQPDDL